MVSFVVAVVADVEVAGVVEVAEVEVEVEVLLVLSVEVVFSGTVALAD